jgi:hypothetical protein
MIVHMVSSRSQNANHIFDILYPTTYLSLFSVGSARITSTACHAANSVLFILLFAMDDALVYTTVVMAEQRSELWIVSSPNAAPSVDTTADIIS